MKKKTKVIASALTTIALCLSLAVGGTFALFTSKSKVEVNVATGTVNVTATAQNLTLYSPTSINSDGSIANTDNAATESAFANGGTATLEGGTITLSRMTAGDKATFNIVINNGSNVKVNYRTVIKVSEDDGLFSGLKITVGTEEYNGATIYSQWVKDAGSEDVTVPVAIELPVTAGNAYQNKSCTISYAVEAVQGNAYVTDAEAMLITSAGTTEYATLADALAAAQTGDTVKLMHAGMYAPFTVATEGVTVEGIIGETKADSTVFVTTASQNVKLAANNVTLKNIWVEVGAAQTGISGWTQRGALNGDVRNADNFTIDGCYFNGNNLVDRAFIFCKSKLTVKNSTFEKFNYCAFDSMDDNNTPEKIEIVGNTFKGLNVAYDIYAGKGYTGTEKNLVINNNVSDNGAIVRIWDYAQYVRSSEGSAFKAEVKGNDNISLYLTHFDNHFVTPIDTDETGIVYQMEVAFPATVASGSYKVYNADGSEITTFGDHKTTRVHNGNTVVYALRAGDYMLKNDDITYLFTVTDHTAGVLGSGYTATNVREAISNGFYYNISDSQYEIYSAAGLTAFEKSVNVSNNTYADKTVKLMDNIDLAGIEWTPVGQTGATQFQGVFDGQNYTISNMTVNNPSERTNVSSGFFGWLENTSGVIVKNVKFENANVTGSHYVGVVSGYLSGTVTDCIVNNSTINGIDMNDDANGDKIGGIVGFINAGTLTNNKVTNSTVKGNRDIGGIVGAIIAGSTVTGNAVSDTEVIYKTVKSYASAGEIVSGRTGFVPDASNTATNVTIILQA